VKTCTACGVEKPLTEFYTGVQGRSKIRRPVPTCKPCNKARTKAYAEANREQVLESMRNSHYKAKYNLTAAEADALKAVGCALCGKLTGLHIDHDHETGRVRGVLCTPHNTAIGALGDNVEGLMAAATYLLLSEDILTGAAR
jgi:hypothetical protein